MSNPSLSLFRRITGFILLLCMSAVFIYSGISKLYPFEPFQWTFVDMGISNMTAAGIIGRLFIGLEFILGIFLLLHLFLRSFTYPATITLLVVFIGYLILLIIQQGNNGSCGCFGNWIYMKPLQAIWKNLIMIAVTFLLIYIYPFRSYKNQELVAVIAGMAALVTPFIILPLHPNNLPEVAHESIDLSPLYTSEKNTPPTVELRTGKHIIAFMSLTCPHCKKAAYLLQTIHHRNPDFPIYFVLNGLSDQEKPFFDITHSAAVPHTRFIGSEEFVKMAGPYVPAIFWVNNGIIEKKSNYTQLDPQLIKSWLSASH